MSGFTLVKNKNIKIQSHSRVLKAEDYAMVLQAADLVKQAEKEAQKIVDDAKAAYESEKARGYEDGSEEGKAKQSEKMIGAMIESVHYFSEVENKLVDIVMSSTKKILDSFDDVELTQGIVRQALDKVRNESKITLRVYPEHAEAVRTKLREITANYANIGFIDVVADSHIPETACKVETEMGSVDTSIDLQLRALRTALSNNFASQVALSE